MTKISIFYIIKLKYTFVIILKYNTLNIQNDLCKNTTLIN